MLDRAKLAAELNHIADDLFIDTSDQFNLAREIWEKIARDPTFAQKAAAAKAPWPVPTWQGELDQVVSVAHKLATYDIVSVDGSQIYPDRHQGISCFLINTGSVIFRYGQTGRKMVEFSTAPYVFSGYDQMYDLEPSVEVVNCQRQGLELHAGFDAARRVQREESDSPLVLVFDGSLIFWHLEAKEMMLKQAFLPQYLAVLHQLHLNNIITCSYISMPKSRELVNLIRLELCGFDTKKTELFKKVERVVDASIARLFLQPFERTNIFKNRSSISDEYPDELRPYFFYLHVGDEIGRVEIPAWVAAEEDKVTLVVQAMVDQCQKGRGYPVVLAEAHEQAVVKGPDREFFYHLIAKMGIERKVRSVASLKSIKKRGMGI